MSRELLSRLSSRITSRTPVILQGEAAECGLACMAMIAGHHGHRLDLPAIRRRIALAMGGATLKDLVQLGGRLGLATRALRLGMDDLRRLRLPCILHWNRRHFVVLTRVTGRHAHIHDPAIGLRRLPLDEVSAAFTGIALEAWPTGEFRRCDERARIRLTDLVLRTAGIGRAAVRVLAISALIELVTIALPIGFQLVLDEVIVAADRDLLTLIAIALAMLLVLQVGANLARTWIAMLVGSSLILQWRVALFDRLMRLPLGFFEKRHVGDIVSRFSSVDSVQQVLTTNAIQSLLDGVMSVLLVAMMWLYGGWLAAVALAGTLAYALFRLASYRAFRRMCEEGIIHAAQESTHFMESVRGIASVKVLGLEPRRRGTWINHLVERINAELRVQRLETWYQAAGGLLFGLDRVLIIWLGVRAVIEGPLSVGMFVAFLAYKDQFATRIVALIDTGLQFRMLSLHGERISDIALAEPEEPDERHALPAPPVAAGGAAALEVRDLSYRYAETEPMLLRELNLTVARGECLGIAGPSGVGKTTLLKLLSGLAAPLQGQILIDGVPVGSMGLAAYRARIGCVLQDDRLFAGSIRDNIAGFDSAVPQDWLHECARMAAIHDDIMALPMGYETLVGDMGSTLSGGQRQRVVLARALCRRPAVLFLDEATSHLDSANEQAINAAVRRLPMTRIIVAHRDTTLATADRVLRLDGSGGLVAVPHGPRLPLRSADAPVSAEG
ncbi:peptidase domain-containing ABC transporter [Paracoccus sp. MKU1]|uniref:peptidase domain-containing ABC transporter n=1 Tax=Paracoccus sp. MKU1 TaxID=1745182 RepID=UPI00071917B2|nr:peptidase domain-containing ABC transporter [Paracoccus sp. MKU1]KRW96721.1 ABC transporter [Paracoccus sp. MKU1]